MAGASLVKPDMSHMETWPDYFESGVTYIPHAWDFSDFQAKISELLDSPVECHRIAQAAQDRYLGTLSQAGGEEFADHLISLVRKAVENTGT